MQQIVQTCMRLLMLQNMQRSLLSKQALTDTVEKNDLNILGDLCGLTRIMINLIGSDRTGSDRNALQVHAPIKPDRHWLVKPGGGQTDLFASRPGASAQHRRPQGCLF